MSENSNKEERNNEDIFSIVDKLKHGLDASKVLSDFGKETLKFGKSDEAITKADQQSSSELFLLLDKSLNAVNEEIANCNDKETLYLLYKQRENLLDRMSEEKEKQRYYHQQREDKDRTQAQRIFAMVSAAALGVGSVALKVFIDNKK